MLLWQQSSIKCFILLLFKKNVLRFTRCICIEGCLLPRTKRRGNHTLPSHWTKVSYFIPFSSTECHLRGLSVIEVVPIVVVPKQYNYGTLETIQPYSSDEEIPQEFLGIEVRFDSFCSPLGFKSLWDVVRMKESFDTSNKFLFLSR